MKWVDVALFTWFLLSLVYDKICERLMRRTADRHFINQNQWQINIYIYICQQNITAH